MNGFDQFRDENPYAAPQEYVLAEVADESEQSGCWVAGFIFVCVLAGVLTIAGWLLYLLLMAST